MTDISAKRFFERAVTLHRYDCELVAAPQPSDAESGESQPLIDKEGASAPSGAATTETEAASSSPPAASNAPPLRKRTESPGKRR